MSAADDLEMARRTLIAGVQVSAQFLNDAKKKIARMEDLLTPEQHDELNRGLAEIARTRRRAMADAANLPMASTPREEGTSETNARSSTMEGDK